MPSGVALVTTVWLERRARHVDVLNAFLLYHIAIGVDDITVFFDGNATSQSTVSLLHADVQALVTSGRITLLYRSDDYQSARSADGELVVYYADCANYEKLRETIPRDVASRQMLHAELAMRRFVQRNQEDKGSIRWLLHLDVDELFYYNDMASSEWKLDEFIEAVDQAQIDQLTIVNYEGVPTTWYGGNYFVSTTRFRRHTARIPLSSASHAAMCAWQAKSPYDQFFLFYDNGKSLVRVPETTGNVIPASVHHWKSTTERHWHSVTNFYDPRRSDVGVWHEPTPQLRCCVLHFPVCGLEWLVEKYERLGAFPNVWGGTGGTTPMAMLPCFHRQARDACQNGETELKRLYETQVMVARAHEAFWRQQLSSGVCEEITFAREVLVSKGFTTGHNETIAEAIGSTAKAENTTLSETSVTGLTVEKAWVLAAISDQYLS